MDNSKLDLERVESTTASSEVANVIVQLQEWHQVRIDKLQTIVQAPKDTKLQLGDIKISDPAQFAMFQAGVKVAFNMFEKFPVSINPLDEDSEEDEDGY